MKLGYTGRLPSKFQTGDKLDPDSLDTTNNLIGVLLRMASIFPDRYPVDKGMMNNEHAAGQFAQTGGNIEQIKKKRSLNEEIEALRKPTDP